MKKKQDKAATAMAAAFAEVGIKKPEDLKKVFGQADEAAGELEALRRQAAGAGLDPVRLRELEKTLRARAADDAEVLGNLFQSRVTLRRLGGEDESSPYRAQLLRVEELIKSLRGKNPFAAELAARAAKRHKRQVTLERQAAAREEIRALKEGTISLHEACAAGKDGPIALRVQYNWTRGGREETRSGWLRLDCKSGWATPTEHFNLPRGLLRVLGLTEDAPQAPRRVHLNPPEFRSQEGESFFPNVVREALANLWKFEETLAADRKRTTGTVSQLLAGEAVRVVAYRSSWREPGEWNKPRPLKVDLEGDGKGGIFVHQIVAQHKGWDDLEGLQGKRFPLAEIPSQLARFLRACTPKTSSASDEEEASADEAEA